MLTVNCWYYWIAREVNTTLLKAATGSILMFCSSVLPAVLSFDEGLRIAPNRFRWSEALLD